MLNKVNQGLSSLLKRRLREVVLNERFSKLRSATKNQAIYLRNVPNLIVL
jgi:fructose-bisphosphate aldolase class 1